VDIKVYELIFSLSYQSIPIESGSAICYKLEDLTEEFNTFKRARNTNISLDAGNRSHNRAKLLKLLKSLKKQQRQGFGKIEEPPLG
jgi:hypothetical protein